MTLTQEISNHIRTAKAADPQVRISDFQLRVEADRALLVNLKTGATRIIPATDDYDYPALH